LSEQKRQQVIALGRLKWPLRRIEAATGVRRETVSAYLKAAGVPIRPERTRRPPKPASQVSTDPPGKTGQWCPPTLGQAAAPTPPRRLALRRGLRRPRRPRTRWGP
jgi:hypothetical protein